jgi:hypothetical protein
MGKITENCDLLGLKETQQYNYLNPQNPDAGVTITYSQGRRVSLMDPSQAICVSTSGRSRD